MLTKPSGLGIAINTRRGISGLGYPPGYQVTGYCPQADATANSYYMLFPDGTQHCMTSDQMTAMFPAVPSPMTPPPDYIPNMTPPQTATETFPPLPIPASVPAGYTAVPSPSTGGYVLQPTITSTPAAPAAPTGNPIPYAPVPASPGTTSHTDSTGQTTAGVSNSAGLVNGNGDIIIGGFDASTFLANNWMYLAGGVVALVLLTRK